jgi:hypothetical protein
MIRDSQRVGLLEVENRRLQAILNPTTSQEVFQHSEILKGLYDPLKVSNPWNSIRDSY